MKNYNTQPVYTQVLSSQIFSDPAYQRPVNTARVNKIVREFNPALVNPIKLSRRDERYYVFDGQHTLMALLTRNGFKELLVPCVIYEGLTQQDEAFLFAQQTGVSQKVSSKFKLRALYIAENPQVTDMYNIVNSMGFVFDFSKQQGDRKIIAEAALWRMYQNSTRQEFIDSLEIVRNAWNFNPDSLKAEILGGVHSFYTYPEYRGMINKKLLIQRLSTTDPRDIIRKGKYHARGGDLRFAKYIADIYTKNLRNNRLPCAITLPY